MTARRELARAQSLIELRRYAEAQSVLATFLATEPGSADALVLLAICREGLGEYAGMLDAAEQAVAAAPEEPEGYRLASAALRRLDRPNEAVGRAEVAVRLDPDAWYTHAELAIALSELPDRRDEALRVAHTTAVLGPNEAGAHVTVGLVASACHRWELAERAYLRAAAIEPDSAVVHNNLALVRSMLDRPTDAWLGFRTAIGSDPTLEIARGNLERHSQAVLMRTGITLFACWLLLMVVGAAQVQGGTAGTGAGHVARLVLGIIAGSVAAAIIWWPLRTMTPVERRSLGQLVRATPSLRLGGYGLAGTALGVLGMAAAPWPALVVASIVVGLAGLALLWASWVWRILQDGHA